MICNIGHLTLLIADIKETENYLITFFSQRVHSCVAFQMVSDRLRHVYLENGRKGAGDKSISGEQNS